MFPNLPLFTQSYYMGCSFWVHRRLVLPPIKIAWSLLLQVLFLSPAKMSGLKLSMMSAWEFLFVCWGEKYNLWILFCSHAWPVPFSRMNFSFLELNVNSNFAQMAIVLRDIFPSSQASLFIKLPKFKRFHMLNYLALHLGKKSSTACKRQHPKIQYDLPKGWAHSLYHNRWHWWGSV